MAALGTLKHGSVFAPLFAAFGPEPIRQRLRLGDGAGAGHDPGALPPEGGRMREQLPAAARTCCWSTPAGERAAPGRGRLRRAHGRRRPGPSSRSRRPRPRTWRCCTSPAARPARPRARSTCTRPWSPTTRPAPVALGPAPRRHVLVHRRPGLGDRHVVRHHRPADPRRHQHRRRGRVRRRALVPDAAGAAGHRLVHRADRDPDADAGRGRPGRRATTCPRCGSWPASASR